MSGSLMGVKELSLYLSRWHVQPELILICVSLRNFVVSLLSPGWVASSLQGYLLFFYQAGTHLYSRVREAL